MSVWDSIVGQQAVVGQLQAIVSGDPKALAQSWLICSAVGMVLMGVLFRG